MKILLYNPDNGVTRNFMPHLWMFLLKTITPPEHLVFLIDGNARPMGEKELVQFVHKEKIGLVGIGSMTRMIAKAYHIADTFRAAGVPVVMGGPHVTGLPDEALGRDGGKRHADAVALGEADETWPTIIEDAEQGNLKDIYQSTDAAGSKQKPNLQHYPLIPWEKNDLKQFNLVPKIVRPIFNRMGKGWGKFYMVPMETGRGCPYACEFCTVTGFFGDAVRFRTNQSVVDEILRIKKFIRSVRAQAAVFFVDDNFAVNPERTKSLLRDIIAADAQIFWIAQISINLLRDEELLDLIAASGGIWIFIGLESVDKVNLTIMHKAQNRPDEYGTILTKMADRNIFAITSFIFGLDNDTSGIANRTLQQIHSWPPGLPVFGQLTPYPATHLYSRLEDSQRMIRPKHWLNFEPFTMAHKPLNMTIPDVHDELKQAWLSSYNPHRNAQAIAALNEKHVGYRIVHFVTRLFFRGIYFPQMGKLVWIKTIMQNWHSIFNLIKDCFKQSKRMAK